MLSTMLEKVMQTHKSQRKGIGCKDCVYVE